jgi:hypothetical protein
VQQTTTEIKKLYKQMEGIREEMQAVYQKSAPVIWKIGKLLVQVKNSLDHGEFTPWVEQNLPFEPRTARRYMQVFEAYKTVTLSDLKKLSTTDVFVTAGVRKLLPAPEKEVIHVAGEAEKKPVDLFFTNKKGISDNPPDFHVVDFIGDRLYGQRKGQPPRLIGDFYFRPPTGFPPELWLEFHANIRIACEIHFKHIEECEESGICHPPKSVRKFMEQARKSQRKRRSRVVKINEGGHLGPHGESVLDVTPINHGKKNPAFRRKGGSK